MAENRVSISKIIEGLKKYFAQKIGTATERNLLAIFLTNNLIQARAQEYLKLMAAPDGKVDINILRQNALEMLEKLPSQTYVADTMIATITITKGSVESIYNIIAAAPETPAAK